MTRRLVTRPTFLPDDQDTTKCLGESADVARVPDAACIGHLGLRLFLRPDGPVPDASLRLANREILHVEVTRHPTAGWIAQQIVECCAWDRAPPRFLIHDRDSRYGASFDRRVRGLGIRQVRTPFRSPRANACAA